MAGEAEFRRELKEFLEKEFSNYSVKENVNLIYKVIVDNNLDYRPKDPKNPRKGNYAFQTDIVIAKKQIELPLVVIETKYRRFSSHDVITYSTKALRHKEIYPYIRYGLVVGGINAIDNRFFTHNVGFDFAFALKKVNDKDDLLVLKTIIQEQLESAELLLDIFANKKKAKVFNSIIIKQPLRISYTPTRYEQKLIARVIDEFKANGYESSTLPEIYLSFEAPPLFVTYPELEEEEIEKRKPDRERKKPETISIEQLLGRYNPDPPRIILYQRGLRWCARKYNFNEELLRAIVLIHEIGHWITHLLPNPKAPSWPTKHYNQTSDEVHEGWAQLITWWVVDKIGGKIKEIFEELNKHQSYPYHVFEKFKNKPVRLVINSLEKLRQLGRGARLEDWENFVP